MRKALWIIAVLLFLPQVFAPASQRPWQLGAAGVFSGDEPHYLLMLNSVLRDRDLDMANNYRAVHLGSDQAGALLAGTPIDHHTTCRVDGRRERWDAIYEQDHARWTRDAQGLLLPALRPGAKAPAHEYSVHWPGLPILLSLLLFPLAATPYLEPAVLLCSFLAAILAMLAFVSIARSLGAPDKTIIVVTALTFLGTPVWHYSRALFCEPYALACVLGAHALYLRRRQAQAADAWSATMLGIGAMCGAAFLIKNTFVLCAVPLGLHVLVQRRWRELATMTLPPLAALSATLWLNHSMFGSYLEGPQGWVTGEPIYGTLRTLFSTRHGLLPYAPIVLSALLGWPAFLRLQPLAARLAASTFAFFFVVTVMYAVGDGGYCYGPRYLAPFVPLLMLGLLFRAPTPAGRWPQADVVVLGVLSIIINGMGAVQYWRFFSLHPFAGSFG